MRTSGGTFYLALRATSPVCPHTLHMMLANKYFLDYVIRGVLRSPSFADSVVRNKQYILIEYCCSPGSTFGTRAPASALVVRVTKDMDATSTPVQTALLNLIEQAHKLGTPVAIWASTPCTGGSQMQNLNVSRFGVTEKLRAHWKEFRLLWNAFLPLARAVHTAGGLVAIEWPTRCTYWRDHSVLRLLRRLRASTATMAACRYGLRPQRNHDPDEYIGKTWRLSTNCSGFAAQLDRRCEGGHRHITTVGGETAASAFYPEALAEAVHFALSLWAGGLRQGSTTP